MSWSPLLRALGRSRRHQTVRAGALPAYSPPRRSNRHPAMVGLDVSPVHGRHCICERCARQARVH